MLPQKITVTLKEINNLAKLLALKVRGGEVFALIGPLGAGKTTFAKAFGKQLGVRKKITSPTFTIMHEHKGKVKKTKDLLYLYHLDLYRTKSFGEVIGTGITENWGSPNSITLIEWANKIKKYLPKNTVTIYFKNAKNDKP